MRRTTVRNDRTLGLIVLFVPSLPTVVSENTATGHFEVYCDGVGLFLTKIDGAPAPGRLVLFSSAGEHIRRRVCRAVDVVQRICLS